MSGYILVLEEEDQVSSVLELAVEDLALRVVTEKNVQKAKRNLLQDLPVAIICRVAIGDDSEAGFRFANDLQEHPILKNIPILLVTDSVQDNILRRAGESGARGLIPWPLKVDLFRQRVLALVAPSLPQSAPEPPAPEAIEAAGSPEEASSSGPSDPKAKKMELVRKILAAVFLRVQQHERLASVPDGQLPQFVLQVLQETFKESIRPTPEPLRPAAEKKVAELDFDVIFGRKK